MTYTTIECENCGHECADLGYRYQVCPECGNPLYLQTESEEEDDYFPRSL